MIHCQTLGPVAVSVHGQAAPPELLWRKHLALVIVLARAPRRTRSREQLTGLLWAEKADSAARHSLNEGLRVIRRAAGDDALDTNGDQVTIADGAVELDVEVLERVAGAGDLAAASALVAGEFLEGFAIPGASEFEDWLSGERRHWAGRGASILAAWSLAEANSGRLSSAVSAAERALALDPLAESAFGALLRALTLQGERTAALERYDRYAALVRERLSTEPSVSVLALVERIRADRSRASRPPAIPESVAERRRVPLAGRDAELAALLETYATVVASRQVRAALLISEPGMGRTRLAEELAGRVRLDGGVVVHVRAVSGDRHEAESGMLALASGDLTAARGVSGAAPEAIAVLAERVATWAERFGRESRVTSPGALSLGAALVAVLRAASEESPLLLWVDDAHFLDPASFEFLDRIPRDLAGLPVMLVMSAATIPVRDEVDALRARMGRELEGVTLTPGPLGTDAIRAMVAWALPTYTGVELDRLVRRLSHDTAGLPLLLVELLGAVADGLDLAGDGNAWPEPFRTLDQTMPGDLPDSITAAIRMSFRRLGPNAQKVLAAASVFGDRVLSGELALATELTEASVVAALDELEWSRWLVAEPRGYAFLARVVRDVIARDMLTPGQRKRLLARRTTT